MWKKSLRARLTLYVVLPVMLALVMIGGLGFYSAYDEAQEIYDTELTHIANLMHSLLTAEDEEEAKHSRQANEDEDETADIVELGTDFEATGQHHARELAFRIWKDGDLLFYSKKAKDFGAERVTPGFSNQDIDGQEWRFYVLVGKPGGYTLEVAQRSSVRLRLIAIILTTIFSPLALLLPVILIVVWFGLRTGLRPLLAVSEAVKSRSSHDLKPLPTCDTLIEIAPLVNSINGLLNNLDYALKKERRFTDFAAHELRTPIAIFKTQAQTALKSTDDDERRIILEAQVKAADRVTTMVDQLLTLARLEHTDIPTEKLSLAETLKSVFDERAPVAKQKNITLDFKTQVGPFIHGNKELLTIIISNLVDNAIKYTPKGGKVTATLATEDHTANVFIIDTGPGIPEENLPHVTERFYRVAHHSQPGAGLGLTIVKRATELMGATLTLRNSPKGKGLEVILGFSVA